MQFKFKGGTIQMGEHPNKKTCKFFLFLICDKQEKILGQALSQGYAVSLDKGKLQSKVANVKVFLSQQGFGLRKTFMSYYIDLSNPKKRIRITGFDGDSVFEANGRFLRKGEVADLIGKETPSYKYFINQSRLPLSEIEKLVSISELGSRTQGIRKLRI